MNREKKNMIQKTTRRIFLPALNSFEDEVFLEMVSEVLGRKPGGNYFDLSSDEIERLRQELTPDLLLDTKYGVEPGVVRDFITKKKSKDDTTLVSDIKKKAIRAFSPKRLSEYSGFDYQPHKDHRRYHDELVRYLGLGIDMLDINTPEPENPMICDECGAIFENMYGHRLPSPLVFKEVWNTFNTYTPGRLSFALTKGDYEDVRKAMGSGYLNWICPLCLWKELIRFVSYSLLGKRDPDKSLILSISLTGEIDDIDDLAVEIAHRMKYPDEGSEIDERLDTYDIEDSIITKDMNYLELCHGAVSKIILFIEASGLVLSYRTKDQRKRVEMREYVDPDLRLRGEAKLLYDAVIDIIHRWEIGGVKLGDIMSIEPEEKLLRQRYLKVDPEFFRDILLFVETKVGNYYPAFIAKNKKTKPLVRWTRIRQIISQPELQLARIVRATYHEMSDNSKKSKRKNQTSVEFNSYLQDVENMMRKLTKTSTESDFVEYLTKFLLSLNPDEKSELGKWRTISGSKGEGSYEKPIRDFFHIMNKQRNIKQGVDEFVSYLSRRGVKLDKKVVSKIDEFQKHCESVLPDLDAKKAISVSFFRVYRTLLENSTEESK